MRHFYPSQIKQFLNEMVRNDFLVLNSISKRYKVTI